MSNLVNLPLLEEMKQDKEYVETYQLETDKGTKRMKERFYNTAAEERNHWIEDKLVQYRKTFTSITDEISLRKQRLFPIDNTETYDALSIDVSNLLYCVRLDSNSSNAFKLNIDYILSSINDLTSLEELNQKIGTFVSYFRQFGVVLTIDDFKYTMFTEMYMDSFFRDPNYNSLKDIFEKVYFKCPDIKLQLKMNLQNIVQKYDDKLAEYVTNLKNTSYANFGITDNAVAHYVRNRLDLGEKIASDEYYNTMVFIEGKKKIQDYLEGSPTRTKIYNSFTLSGDYDACSDEDKKVFNDSMMGFYLTLNELKKFYRYEFILKDLIGFYKEKDTVKAQYTAKKKEIEKEEKVREKINKQYERALGVGFLAKVSEDKQKYFMLQMNGQIRKLNDLYKEFNDLEIRYQVSTLSDSSSLYDLFLISLTSFPFLEKCFTGEDFEENTLEENITEYLRFLYNPNNDFLRKVNSFADYNITDIVADKYRLLNLNITSEMIQTETIDATLQDVQFINLIQNIERSKTSVTMISNLCKMNAIISTKE